MTVVETLTPAATGAKRLAPVACLGLALLSLSVGQRGARAESCPAPPPPVRSLDLPRFYADAAGSEVDPKLDAAHKAAVAPLTDFLRHVTADADKAWRRAKPEARREAGRCAIAWLVAWAHGEAWLGKMATRQAEYQRKWDLAGTALAYLKVKGFAEPAERAVIEPWLLRFADASRAFFDDPGRKRNNHWYWLGLGLGATALATGSERHWLAARGIFEDAMRDVSQDGTLPHELARKARALHYHAFAVEPLVVLAELARSRGEDWYKLGNGALHRLVRATLAGFERPEVFATLAGVPQEQPVKPGAGWMQIYAARFPDRTTALPAGSQDSHRWLGGNATVLAEALGGKR